MLEDAGVELAVGPPLSSRSGVRNAAAAVVVLRDAAVVAVDDDEDMLMLVPTAAVVVVVLVLVPTAAVAVVVLVLVERLDPSRRAGQALIVGAGMTELSVEVSRTMFVDKHAIPSRKREGTNSWSTAAAEFPQEKLSKLTQTPSNCREIAVASAPGLGGQ
eukprot:scpid42297/ scgid27606/ 